MERNELTQEELYRSNKTSVILVVGLGALLLLAFGLRAYHLGAQDIWWDEARNIATASRPLDAIASAKELDIHPPLYFYLLHFWVALVGTSEFGVRFFSLWFGVVTVALVYRVGSYLKDRHVGWWAAFLAALTPLLVDEAQQARMYTLVIFLATLSTYLLLRAVNTRQPRLWIGYVLSATASLYVHYSFVYILAAQNLCSALEFWNSWHRSQTPRKFFQWWTGTQVAIVLLYLLQVPNILRQLQIYGNPGMTAPSLAVYLTELTRAFLFGQKMELDKTEIASLAMIAALALTLVAALAERRDALADSNGAVILIWLTLPLLTYFIVLQKSPQFTPRYIMIAAPALYCLLALFFGKLSRRSTIAGAVVALLLLIASAGAWESLYFNPAFFNDDTRGVARFISETATKDDVVFIDVPFPFDYYYRGDAPAQYLFVDIHTTARVLTQMTQDKKRVFWITWYKSDTDPRRYVRYLLDKYAVFLSERDFRGYHVAWYQLPSKPEFSLACSPQTASAVFGGQIMLTGFAFGGAVTPTTPNADEARVAVGSKAWVALWWQIAQPVQENYKVSIQVRDAAGNPAAQDDRMLINDRHLHTSLWTTHETAINVYTPEFREAAKPGEYTMYVIVYNPDTDQRLGIGSGDMLALGKVQVVP